MSTVPRPSYEDINRMLNLLRSTADTPPADSAGRRLIEYLLHHREKRP